MPEAKKTPESPPRGKPDAPTGTDEAIEAVVTIRYRLPNRIDPAALDAMYMGSLDRCVREMLREEGVSGLAEDSNGEIVSVVRAAIQEARKSGA